jgi:hypothetical protein
VNTEERKLADLLHRITPEPPRPVTVEQVAYRLVSEPAGARLGRGSRGREAAGARPRRGRPVFSRALAPVLAAAAVVVIAGASAGIAVLASSHHHTPSPAGGGATSSAVSSASATASSSPSQTSSSTQQTTPATRIAGGPWGAELIDHQSFSQQLTASADGSLYAFGDRTLVRIDPATGNIAATAQASLALPNPPVIIGNTVWVLWSYSGGNVILHGFDARTLAPTRTLLVPAVGAVGAVGSNVVTSGPDGNLYVAAGIAVVVVNPDNGQVLNRINLTAGTTDSVAISPDGSRMYVGVGGFRVLVYDLPSDTVISSTKLTGTDSGGDLVATSGGVWGTTGSGMSEWTWFAPNGDLTRAVRIGSGARAG